MTKYVRGDAADASRVTETIYPDGGRVVLAYNADGTVKTRTDQRNWKTTFTYDTLARLTQEDVARLTTNDPPVTGTTQVTCTYDALGRVTQVFDNNGPDSDVTVDTAYSWVAASSQQKVVEKLTIGGVQMDNITLLIRGDHRLTFQYPNGRTVSFGYDNINRLNGIVDNYTTTIASYLYKGRYLDHRDLNYGVLRESFTNTSDLDGYDSFGRPARVQHLQMSGPTNVVKLNYGYDYASNPLYIEDNVTSSMSELYAYDSAHRLIDMKRGTLNAQKTGISGTPSFTQAWTLDKLGNWKNLNENGTADLRQHNEVNEISLPAGGYGQIRTYGGYPREITHDAAGNVATRQTEDGTTTWRYTYDYRNRLIMAESKTTGSYATVVQYLYDGNNRRVKKDLTTGTDVVYIYDGWRCIEEREYISSAWKAKRQFVFGGRYLDEELLFDKDTNNDGNCTDSGGSTRYLYCQNANWNVVALTDNTGAAVERVSYTAYGQPTVSQVGQAQATGNPFLFQGQRYCPETGLYYFKNRDYLPTLGRFIEWDPVGYEDAKSAYSFLNDCPDACNDPLGLQTVTFSYGIIHRSGPLGTEGWTRGDSGIVFIERSNAVHARVWATAKVAVSATTWHWYWPPGSGWGASDYPCAGAEIEVRYKISGSDPNYCVHVFVASGLKASVKAGAARSSKETTHAAASASLWTLHPGAPFSRKEEEANMSKPGEDNPHIYGYSYTDIVKSGQDNPLHKIDAEVGTDMRQGATSVEWASAYAETYVDVRIEFAGASSKP